MGQPNFHTGELPQQPSELFEDPIAGRTQPWIVGWQIHALLLSQSFAWMLKNVLLLDAKLWLRRDRKSTRLNSSH